MTLNIVEISALAAFDNFVHMPAQPLVKDVEIYCRNLEKNTCLYPIAFCFSKALQELLLTTPKDACSIMDDILIPRMDSDTIVALKKQKMNFIFSAKEMMASNTIDPLVHDRIRRKIDHTAMVFDPFYSTMTDTEYTDLQTLAFSVDAIKNYPRVFIFPPR